MNCPRCNSDNTIVHKSSKQHRGLIVRRVRICREHRCNHRWTSIEVPGELLSDFMHRAIDRSLAVTPDPLGSNLD